MVFDSENRQSGSGKATGFESQSSSGSEERPWSRRAASVVVAHEGVDPLALHAEPLQAPSQLATTLDVDPTQPTDDIVGSFLGPPFPGLVQQVSPVNAINPE